MINRRHIRIKVMQSAYAVLLSENDKLDIQERYLKNSIEWLHHLYIVHLQLLVSIFETAVKYHQVSKENYIQSHSDLVNSANFANNKLLIQIKEALQLQDYSNIKTNWKNHQEITDLIWNKILKSPTFSTYMSLSEPSYKEDKVVVLAIFKKIIAPSEPLATFYEGEVISWVDDIPFVNTWILNNLKSLSQTKEFIPDRLYKDKEDQQFVLDLFRKTVLNFAKYEKDIDACTPNWDSERITKIDKLLIVMSIAEFFHFPSIPTKVSINEYIEIAKDYATPKSSYFINGVLDKLLEDYNKEKRIHKIGRGLL